MEKIDNSKEYALNRFEFAIYVNDNVICKRNFKINFFNEQAFYSLQMKNQLDNIVEMIKDDLKSKSRLYTWYYFDENHVDEEFIEPLIPEWECTFKIVITDNGQEVLTKIWDGSVYPKAIREKVDLTNKFIEVNGTKVELTKIDPNRLPIEAYINKVIVGGRQDLVTNIIKKICAVCSPENITMENGQIVKSGAFADEQDYILSDIYGNGKKHEKKKYLFSRQQRYAKLCTDIGNSVSEKTKRYFEVECYNMFSNNKRK